MTRNTIVDKVIFRVINKETPVTEKSGIRMEYKCMTLEFKVLLSASETQFVTAPVTQAILDMTGISKEELLTLALINTPRLLPLHVDNMDNMMMGIMASMGFDDDMSGSTVTQQIYVVTNKFAWEGAGAMLYPGVLANLARQLDSDLAILPSSIHEVLVMPYSDARDLMEFAGIVRDVNRSIVAKADQLANDVYVYEKDVDRVVKAETEVV